MATYDPATDRMVTLSGKAAGVYNYTPDPDNERT